MYLVFKDQYTQNNSIEDLKKYLSSQMYIFNLNLSNLNEEEDKETKLQKLQNLFDNFIKSHNEIPPCLKVQHLKL